MEDRKTQILRAAMRVFALYGFRRASMEDVAQESALSRPALYQYFRNKDDLVLSCVDLVIEDAFGAAEAALNGITGARAQVSAYLTAYLVFYHRLLVSGPHGDAFADVKSHFGEGKLDGARLRLIARLDELSGQPATQETGLILSQAGEALKMQAPDETTMARRTAVLVAGLVAA